MVIKTLGCQTRTDAFLRIIQARVASNINPTEEYLVELRRRLYDWLAHIERTLQLMQKRQSVSDNAAE